MSDISPKVRPSPSSGTNRESYPKPPSPRSADAITPVQTPSTASSDPSGQRARAHVVKAARRSSSSPSSRRSLARLSPSEHPSPAQRPERTPGAPLSAATCNPVSSATAARPVASQIATAFSRALPSSVSASSTMSGMSAGRGRRSTTSRRITRISATLSGLADAQTSCGRSVIGPGAGRSRARAGPSRSARDHLRRGRAAHRAHHG